MTVALTNTSGRCLTFVLTHDEYCGALGACACDILQGRKARRIPGSLTLASGVTTDGLQEAVLALPDVVLAVRQGRLSVRREAAQPEASTPTPMPASPEAGITPDVTKARKKRGT
jgi:hypothetical protein